MIRVAIYTLLALVLVMPVGIAERAEAEVATYYSDAHAGGVTASGAIYDPGGFTAAHNGYAMGTVLDVCRVDGGGCVTVTVTDTCGGCSIDLSRAAMAAIGGIDEGVVAVSATPV